MSEIINDGGPAFPGSLRDYFAGKALEGLLSNPGGPVQANPINGWSWCNYTTENVVSEIWHIADAMLAAREGKK